MKKKLFSLLMAISVSCTTLAGCGGSAISQSNETMRTGAKWMDSGIYGTFKDMGQIKLQDDFAAYVNRSWAENAQIPDGETNISSRVELTMENDKKKLALLKEDKKDDLEFTSMKNFYDMLLDWDARNKNGFTELKLYAKDIMGITSIDELNKYFSDSKRNLFGSPMIIDSVIANSNDAFTNVLKFEAPCLFAGGNDCTEYYGEGKGESDRLAADRKISEFILTKLGYSESQAKEIFDKAISFEKKFIPGVEAFWKLYLEKFDAAANNLYEPKEIDKIFKNIPIRLLYKNLGYDVDCKFNLAMPDVMKKYDELYTDKNLEDIKAWTLVHTAYDMADYLDRETYEKKAKLLGELNGSDTLPSDEKYALNTIYNLIPGEIDKLYVEYCFDPKIKTQVTQLVDMMLVSYKKMLQEDEAWMSDETKAAAIEKLDNIKVHVCYPDNLPDYSSVKINSGKDGGNVLKAYKTILEYNIRHKAEKLHQKNDGTYWNDEVLYSELGAQYRPSENSININAGICGGDYYNPDWSIEKKLGGLCFVVGHEISHAFDTRGAAYDKDGNYRNWWKPEDKELFQKKVDKLNDYYSRLVPAPQISDKPYGKDGAINLNGEAIADLGSLKCLLSIAKQQPNFDYKTFFTQLAVIQKNARFEQAEKYYILTDVHPVECYRCNIPVQNYDEFIKTFDIKKGDGMYLAPEDRITVW